MTSFCLRHPRRPSLTKSACTNSAHAVRPGTAVFATRTFRACPSAAINICFISVFNSICARTRLTNAPRTDFAHAVIANATGLAGCAWRACPSAAINICFISVFNSICARNRLAIAARTDFAWADIPTGTAIVWVSGEEGAYARAKNLSRWTCRREIGPRGRGEIGSRGLRDLPEAIACRDSVICPAVRRTAIFDNQIAGVVYLESEGRIGRAVIAFHAGSGARDMNPDLIARGRTDRGSSRWIPR